MSRALERAEGRRRPLLPRHADRRRLPHVATRILRIVAGGLPGGTYECHALGRGAVMQVALDLEAAARRLWSHAPVERHPGPVADREAWNREQHDRSR